MEANFDIDGVDVNCTIHKLNLQPDDILVVGLCFEKMTPSTMRNHAISVRNGIRKMISNKIIITSNDTTLTVLHADE